MSKHEKYTRLKRQIGLCLAMGVALFSAAPMAFAATSVVANNQLPTGGTPMHNTTTITPNMIKQMEAMLAKTTLTLLPQSMVKTLRNKTATCGSKT